MKSEHDDEIEEMWRSVEQLFQLPLPLFVKKESKYDVEQKVREAMRTTTTFTKWSSDFTGIVGDFNLKEPYSEYESNGDKVSINHVSVCVDIVDESSRYRLVIRSVSPCSSINSWNHILNELVHAMSSFCMPNERLLI
jgi:hypothetical protein